MASSWVFCSQTDTDGAIVVVVAVAASKQKWYYFSSVPMPQSRLCWFDPVGDSSNNHNGVTQHRRTAV